MKAFHWVIPLIILFVFSCRDYMGSGRDIPVAEINLVAPDTVAFGDTVTFKAKIVEKHTDEQIEFDWYIPVGKVLSKYEPGTSYNTGTKNTITWQAPQDTVNFTLGVEALSSSDDFVTTTKMKSVWVWPAK